MGRSNLCYVVAALSVGCLACDQHDRAQRKVVASDAKWQITAIGSLTKVGGAFGRNYVTFEAHRFGVPYASGPLFDAGPLDDPFNQFRSFEWIAPNVAHFWTEPTPLPTRVAFTVRNLDSQSIKWLTIRNVDMFLVLEVPANQETSFSGFDWNDSGYLVQGEMEDGSPIPEIGVSTKIVWKTLDIVIRNGAAAISGR
jgi:hypothetical protein